MFFCSMYIYKDMCRFLSPLRKSSPNIRHRFRILLEIDIYTNTRVIKISDRRNKSEALPPYTYDVFAMRLNICSL
jgi:hypothetical protein